MKKISQIIVLAFFAFCILGAGTSDNKYIIKGQDAAVDVDLIFGDGTNLIRVPTGGGNLRFSDNSGAGFTQFSDIGSNSSVLIENATVDTSVAGNALTIDLTVADGTTDPTAGDAVKVSFRDATAADGAYNARTATAALTLVVPSGATLAHEDGVDGFIYVYLLDNASVMELAVSSIVQDENSLISTTVMDAASDGTAIYSTVARSDVPIRLISRLTSNQATAGTWGVDVIENTPGANLFTDVTNKLRFKMNTSIFQKEMITVFGRYANSGTPTVTEDFDDGGSSWISSLTDLGTGQTRINFLAGTFDGVLSPVCTCVAHSNNVNCIVTARNATNITMNTHLANTGAGQDAGVDLVCGGSK